MRYVLLLIISTFLLNCGEVTTTKSHLENKNSESDSEEMKGVAAFGGSILKLKNRWTNHYPHLRDRHGSLVMGEIDQGWWSAQWKFEEVSNGIYRIQRRATCNGRNSAWLVECTMDT